MTDAEIIEGMEADGWVLRDGKFEKGGRYALGQEAAIEYLTGRSLEDRSDEMRGGR